MYGTGEKRVSDYVFDESTPIRLVMYNECCFYVVNDCYCCICGTFEWIFMFRLYKRFFLNFIIMILCSHKCVQSKFVAIKNEYIVVENR